MLNCEDTVTDLVESVIDVTDPKLGAAERRLDLDGDPVRLEAYHAITDILFEAMAQAAMAAYWRGYHAGNGKPLA